MLSADPRMLTAATQAAERLASIGIEVTPAQALDLFNRACHDPMFAWRPNPGGDHRRFIDAICLPPGAPLPTGIHALFGGNRSGKSEDAARAFAHHCRVNLDALSRQRLERGERTPVWVVAVTSELAGEVCWKQKLVRFLPESCIEQIAWENAGKGWPSMVKLRNGVEVIFKAAAQNRTKFQGQGIFGVWIDEQIPDEVLQEIFMRLLDHNALGIISQTPIDPDPAMQRRVERPPPNFTVYHIDIEDNRKSRGGHIDDAVIDLMLAQLKEEDPVLYKTRKSGLFAAMSGLVYPQFSHDLNVKPDAWMRATIEAKWDRLEFYGGVDFGATSPFCGLLVARERIAEGEYRYYVLQEHYQADRPIEHHGGRLIQMVNDWGRPHVRQWFADTGDSTKTDEGERYKVSGRRYLTELGLPVLNATKHVRFGIEQVGKLLGRKCVLVNGRVEYHEPRLYISDACANLIRQVREYRYDRPKQSKVDPPDGKPLKKDDHAPDALRYVIATLVRPAGYGKPTTAAGSGGRSPIDDDRVV